MSSNLKKFPITEAQQSRNRFGKLGTPCIISERWLQFSENATPIKMGDIITVDVMTQHEGKLPRKICSLQLTKQDLIAALEAIN